MRKLAPPKLRLLKPPLGGDGAGIDEKQVERLGAARTDADRSIVEPADEWRDGATWHTQSNGFPQVYCEQQIVFVAGDGTSRPGSLA